MPEYFSPFPKVKYDIKKNGKPLTLTNITVRFKLRQALASRNVVYYTYEVQDGDRPDVIADIYYKDSTLDWLVLLVNEVIDPLFEWPIDLHSLENYIQKKYGSLSAAKAEVHHYEQILNAQKKLFDGTIVPERTIVVDETTYNTLSSSSRRLISSYDYEVKLNDDRRVISLLDRVYVPDVLSAVKGIFT